jgi:hypothetical protein
MSLLIGLLAFFALMAAIAMLAAGLILDSRRENQVAANRLARIGAGIGILGVFGFAVIAAREQFLGMTWEKVAIIPILAGGTIVVARIFGNRRPRN